jgi:hypothetical protein
MGMAGFRYLAGTGCDGRGGVWCWSSSVGRSSFLLLKFLRQELPCFFWAKEFKLIADI